MNVILQRKLLNIATASMVVGSIAAVGWSMRPLKEDAVFSERSVPVEPEPSDRDSGSSVADVDFSRPLAKALFDPPPKPSPPTPTTRPPRPQRVSLDLTLVGTIIQPGDNIAMISDADGEIDIRREGESLELSPKGVTVERIDSDAVTLKYRGAESIVKLQQSFRAPRGRKNNRGSKQGNNR